MLTRQNEKYLEQMGVLSLQTSRWLSPPAPHTTDRSICMGMSGLPLSLQAIRIVGIGIYKQINQHSSVVSRSLA